MICENKIDLYEFFGLKRKGNEQGYLNSYILENYQEFCPDRLRPAMIVCPGGGYWMRSDREAQPIALSYSANGFQSFVLEYTVKCQCEDLKMPTMLIEACMAIAYVRINAQKYNIAPDKITVLGFSAGGHLAGSSLTMFDDDQVKDALGENSKYCRPDFGVLCYPVITFGTATHGGTRTNALNGDTSLYDAYSLEKRVTKNTPPTFIWTTSEDSTVPPVNSLMFATALSENKVPFELHIYQRGHHGLSLGTEEVDANQKAHYPEMQDWLAKSVDFLKRNGCLPIKKEI